MRPSVAGCNYTGLIKKFYFSNETDIWTNAQKDEFRAGALQWEQLRAPSGAGNLLFDVQEVAAGTAGAFKVTLDPSVGTATTDCPGLRIKVNSNAVGQTMRYYAAHEIGHAYGLRHVGRFDNLTTAGALFDSGQTPLMSGCHQPVGADKEKPKVDDYASVWNKASGPSVIADGGFESSLVDAFYKVGAPFKDNTIAAFQGSYTMRLPANSYIAQRVRITGSAASLRARTQYKSTGGGNNFKAQVRTVSYPPPSTDCWLDSPSPGAQWFDVSNGPMAPTSPLAWRLRETVASSPPWSTAGNIDVQVFVNNLSSSEILWVDNLEVQNF